MIGNGDVCTSFRETVGYLEADTSTGTSDDGSLALEGEEAKQAGVLRGGRVVVDEESIGDRIGSHCEAMWERQGGWRENDSDEEEAGEKQLRGRSSKRDKRSVSVFIPGDVESRKRACLRAAPQDLVGPKATFPRAGMHPRLPETP